MVSLVGHIALDLCILVHMPISVQTKRRQSKLIQPVRSLTAATASRVCLYGLPSQCGLEVDTSYLRFQAGSGHWQTHKIDCTIRGCQQCTITEIATSGPPVMVSSTLEWLPSKPLAARKGQISVGTCDITCHTLEELSHTIVIVLSCYITRPKLPSTPRLP